MSSFIRVVFFLDMSVASDDEDALEVNVVGKGTPPLDALAIDTDSVVRSSKRVKRVNLKIGAPFDNSSGNQASLRDSNQVDLLAVEIWIVVQLMADSRRLPLHLLKHRCGFTVTDLDAFHNGFVIDGLRNHVDPTLNLPT